MPGNRKSIRLRDHDYSQEGAYYVTVCTNNRKCMFGNVVDGKMVLNECGRIADKCWGEIPEHFPYVALDEHIIMPNHVHGIINIVKIVGAKKFSPLRTSTQLIQRPYGTSKTVGSVIRGFKIGVTKWIRQNKDIDDVWQCNFYEHIIRNEYDLNRIREYVIYNPAGWEKDEYYCS